MFVRSRRRVAGLVVSLAVFSCSQTVSAQLPVVPHLGYGFARNRHTLPSYPYARDAEFFRDSAFAVADPELDATWYEENLIHTQVQCPCGETRVLQDVQPLVPDSQKPHLKRNVRRKPFHFTTLVLSANNVTLRQVGLSLSDTGQITATGRINHNGGPQGWIKGANAVVHLRAYAAPVPGLAIDRLPLNSPMVWESAQPFWVSRNQPRVVSLIRSDLSYDYRLRRRFDEITHLEVELEVRRDR